MAALLGSRQAVARTSAQTSFSGRHPPLRTKRLKRSPWPHISWTRQSDASSSKLPRSRTMPGNLHVCNAWLST